MAYLLGWKDVLRPIRDGYNHFFPSPDTGPSPEERARQRELDRLKGFAYFDTFDQLESWTKDDVDPIQIANTPLLQRSHYIQVGARQGANVLLCHDYSGNYHAYEAVQGVGVEAESYTCEYLQYVDTFVYFSHKLICIPPPSWTNTLHRNGVKVLGTLLVEPQMQGMEGLLQRDGGAIDGSPIFPMAKKLAEIAQQYTFDGWLINIEKPFPKHNWDSGVLAEFLQQLRDDLGPDKGLVWYDAITIDNKVSYQNVLNMKNMPFAKACEGVLINYCWKEADAISSRQLAQKHGLMPEKVFFGVDVWAQNKSTWTHPRNTYPAKDGGGTNTGRAVNKLAGIGLSVGIFAPAWSFEHFHSSGCGRKVERAMWDGRPSLENVTCPCGDANVRHPPNRGYPITRSAQIYPAGSETFLYTDFSRGFGRHGEQEANRLYEGKSIHSQLSSQSVLPHVSRTSVRDDQVESGINILSQRLKDLAGTSNLIIEAYSVMPCGDNGDRIYERWLPLFTVDMPADGSLQLMATLEHLLSKPATSMSFYLKFTDGVRFLTIEETGDIQTIEASVHFDSETESSGRLKELGIHLTSPWLSEEPIKIMRIQEIRIIPRAADMNPNDLSLDNIRIERREEGEMQHWRLCWTFQHVNRARPAVTGMPMSGSTGPFSHFLVRIDRLDLGRAYALEHVLPTSLMEGLVSDVKVEVVGVGFDGRQLTHTVEMLHV